MRVDLAPKMGQYEIDRLMNDYPALIGWTVKLNNGKRTRGLCDYQEKTIFLAEAYVELNTPQLVRHTVLHEIAHALTPGHSHNAIWKQQAIAFGVSPTPCSSDGVSVPGSYQAVCPSCKKVWHLYRKPKTGGLRWCTKCGRIHGQLVFVRVNV